MAKRKTTDPDAGSPTPGEKPAGKTAAKSAKETSVDNAVAKSSAKPSASAAGKAGAKAPAKSASKKADKPLAEQTPAEKKPAKSASKPAVKAKKPVAKAEKPVAKTEKPVAKTEKPVAKTEPEELQAAAKKSSPTQRKKKKGGDEQLMKDVAAQLEKETETASKSKKKKSPETAAVKPARKAAAVESESTEIKPAKAARGKKETEEAIPEPKTASKAKKKLAADDGVAEPPALDPGVAADKSAKRKKRKYRRRASTPETPVITAKYQGKKISDASMVAHLETQQKPKPVGEVFYSKEELEFFRVLIIEKINDATEELQSIEERLMDSNTGESSEEDATYSLHMADQGTDAMEREKAFLFAARERKFISHLSDALQRIKSGNYGVCISCGQLIDKGRLEAVPHARMCVNCKNQGKLP